MIRSTVYGIEILADTSENKNLKITPFLLDIIAPSSGVQFYRNGIIFLSYSKGDEKIPDKHLSFGSLKTYMAPIVDTVPGTYMPFLSSSSKIFPSEATTFTADFNTMYLSLIPDRGSNEKIFKATFKSSNWVIEDEPLNFCDGNYIYSHPTLSANGTFMIFSSDMSGSAGGLDLWVTKKEELRWSTPENLGKQINSTGNELFASLDNRNNLYFSSDGLPGEGGYDVFVCTFNGTGWDKPVNLSKTINSKDDELAFTVSRIDKTSAFYTSRARSGKVKNQLLLVTASKSAANNQDSDLSAGLLALAGIENRDKTVKQEASEPSAKAVPEKVEQKAIPAEQKTVAKSVEPVKTVPDAKKVASPPQTPTAVKKADEKKDIVIYRVQILANTRPVGSQNITVAGKTYKSFEYLYQGGYRTTVGEFSTMSEAVKLQNSCRQNGYIQAFVVAFRNNIRSTDPALFK
ncbi:MAG: hypothetical protein U5L72_06930 [Bacteroidales bacterium]|nr:hypothetical protein [Bacteroidales bacterium]